MDTHGGQVASSVLESSSLCKLEARDDSGSYFCMKNLLTWREVVGIDMPEQARITNEIRAETMKESARFRGSVRLVTGLFWTDDDYERFRKEILKTPLP